MLHCGNAMVKMRMQDVLSYTCDRINLFMWVGIIYDHTINILIFIRFCVIN